MTPRLSEVVSVFVLRRVTSLGVSDDFAVLTVLGEDDGGCGRLEYLLPVHHRRGWS